MKSEGEDGIGLATCSERRGMMTCMVAMEWQPEGKRKVGRTKTTWRRTVEKESRQERWTSWAEVRGAAQHRASWRENVTALCTSWRGEN